MLTTRSQRWRDRRCHWIPDATEIDPKQLAVDVISTKNQAAPFVRAHHYTASMPVARLSVGLFANARGGRSELVGVCVFSHPVNNASVPKSAGLADPRTACDLGRLVIDDSQGGNAETFLIARAFRLLRREKPEILSVISYADPVRRVNPDGRVILPGHCGLIYRAANSQYSGRSSPRTDLILPDGQPISSRALSKIRNAECGQRYAIDMQSRRSSVPGHAHPATAKTARPGSPISSASASCGGGVIPGAIPISFPSQRRPGSQPGKFRTCPIHCSIAARCRAM